MNLHFANGQYVSVAALGNFVVVKPSIDNFIVSSLKASVNTNAGVNIGASVNWATYVRPPPYFKGYATYVQLIERNWVYSDLLPLYGCTAEQDTASATTYFLDGSDPYHDYNTPKYLSWNDNPEGFVLHADSPSLGPNLCSQASLFDTFETYLQFQPDSAGSIPVTIGRIDWMWSCQATENGGIWTWQLSTSGPTPDWTNVSFPYWWSTYHNN
jgi:hypothetical protein